MAGYFCDLTTQSTVQDHGRICNVQCTKYSKDTGIFCRITMCCSIPVPRAPSFNPAATALAPLCHPRVFRAYPSPLFLHLLTTHPSGGLTACGQRCWAEAALHGVSGLSSGMSAQMALFLSPWTQAPRVRATVLSRPFTSMPSQGPGPAASSSVRFLILGH